MKDVAGWFARPGPADGQRVEYQKQDLLTREYRQ